VNNLFEKNKVLIIHIWFVQIRNTIMWQEARKQEKILKGIMVDYKRRAERRKGYYEKIVCYIFYEI
jgi:hypothetical protein